MTNYTTYRNHVDLIAWGRTPATMAENLQVGDDTVWNYGYRETVVAIEPKGLKSLDITFRSAKSGNLFTRTMRRTTLVGITGTVR